MIQFDWKRASWNLKRWCVSSEKVREFLSIHCSRSDDEFQIIAARNNITEQTKQNISIERTFVGFVHNNC